MKRVPLFVLLLLAALSAGLAGCGGDNGPGRVRLRVINVSPSLVSQPVDVLLNQVTVFRNLAYGTAGPRTEVDAGQNRVDVVQAGSTTPVISNANVTLTPAVDQTVLITGLSGASGATALQVAVLSPEDLSAPPTSGQVRLHFIHASPEAGPANISYTVNGGASQTNSELTGITYLHTASVLATFGSTVFTAQVGAETITSAPIVTEGGKSYTIILAGRPAAQGGNPGLGLLVFTDN